MGMIDDFVGLVIFVKKNYLNGKSHLDYYYFFMNSYKKINSIWYSLRIFLAFVKAIP